MPYLKDFTLKSRRRYLLTESPKITGTGCAWPLEGAHFDGLSDFSIVRHLNTSSLLCLTIGGYTETIEVIEIICQCPQLRSLTYQPISCLPDDSSVQVTDIHKLRRIETSMKAIPIILPHIRAPNIRHLCASSQRALYGPLHPTIKNARPSIGQCISFSWSEKDTATPVCFELESLMQLVGIQIPFRHLPWIYGTLNSALPELRWLIVTGQPDENDRLADGTCALDHLLFLLAARPRIHVQLTRWRDTLKFRLPHARRLWDLPKDPRTLAELPIQPIEPIADAIVDKDVAWLTRHGLQSVLDDE